MGTDLLYYIMDYDGHYYRTNQADQLVAASCEQDAAVFTFAQANSRICVGKKAAFYCMVPVEDETGKADGNECTGSDCQQDDNEEDIEEDKGEAEDEDAGVSGLTEYVSPVKELTFDEVAEQVEKSADSYDLAQMDWEEYLTHFAYIVDGIKGYREELARKHSDIDQKICDVLHYIELCETDNDEAVDLIELLRVCRENRRYIKDELQKIDYFQKNIGTNANAAKAKQALKSIKGLDTRKYKPRKYDELFENCVLKGRRLQRADIQETADEEKRKNRFSQENIFEDKGGEEIMIQERRHTPLDERDNDWLSFARQQAEFYRNAGCYINNLQLDIREIDDEIEDILQKTEDANCNVAQGYKVFRRLKELRLARKAKAKELDCLYALTDYIDCDAFADTCEANLKDVEDILGIKNQKEIRDIKAVDNAQSLQESGDMTDDIAG